MKNVLIIFFVLVFAQASNAATQYLYVRDGGTGSNCTDWSESNVCDQLSTAVALINRSANDATAIYVADGTYLGARITTAASGTKTITIKKATALDHGTDTGWDNGYGDGQASFQWLTRENAHAHTAPLIVDTSYVIIDGNTLSGAENLMGSYGFKFMYPADINTNASYPSSNLAGIHIPSMIGSTTNASYSKVLRCAIEGPGWVSCLNGDPWGCNNIGISSKLNYTDNLEIAYNYFYGWTVQVGLYNGDNHSVHDNYLEMNVGGTATHGEQMIVDNSDSVSIYNNILFQSMTSILGGHNNAHADDTGNSNIMFYNNVADQSQSRTFVKTTLAAPSTTLHVDNINAFRSSSVLATSPFINGTSYTCTGVTADEVNVSSVKNGVSGMLTLSANVSVANGTEGNKIYLAMSHGVGNNDSGYNNVVVSSNFHHNTFIGIDFGSAVFAGTLTDVNSQKSYAYNNLFYDCLSPKMDNSEYTAGAMAHDNNAYLACTGTYNNADESAPQVDADSTNPFTDSANGDYTLNASNQYVIDHVIGKGKTDLGATYAYDFIGYTRDASPDIGAYESGASDTTAPTTTISTSNSTIITDSLTVTGTSVDAVGVSGCKFRIGSAPDASNGTACTGTTSFSCATSGYASGANTLYVGCYDAAGNYGSDSIIVTFTPPTASGCSFSGVGMVR
jgi:hypothetical protein